jgi:hypothetical protein
MVWAVCSVGLTCMFMAELQGHTACNPFAVLGITFDRHTDMTAFNSLSVKQSW